MLAYWLVERKVVKSRINEYFASGLGNSESVGYVSIHAHEKHPGNWISRVDIYNRLKDR